MENLKMRYKQKTLLLIWMINWIRNNPLLMIYNIVYDFLYK